MPTKDRLLVLLQTLQEKSDDQTWLTTADLRKALEQEGHECSIRTLRRDMISEGILTRENGEYRRNEA